MKYRVTSADKNTLVMSFEAAVSSEKVFGRDVLIDLDQHYDLDQRRKNAQQKVFGKKRTRQVMR